MSGAYLTQVKSLRTLIKVRERQGKRLEATLAEARRVLSECEADVEAAIEEHEQSVEDEAAGRQERDDMFSSSFTPAALRSLDFRIEELKAEVVKCERGVAERRKVAERQATVVTNAQTAVRRNEQRVEGFKDRLKKVMDEREATIEEDAEEEAAEAATGRFIARNRAAKAASCD